MKEMQKNKDQFVGTATNTFNSYIFGASLKDFEFQDEISETYKNQWEKTFQLNKRYMLELYMKMTDLTNSASEWI